MCKPLNFLTGKLKKTINLYSSIMSDFSLDYLYYFFFLTIFATFKEIQPGQVSSLVAKKWKS